MINSEGLNQIAANWLHFAITHTADTTWICLIAGLTWLLCRKKAPAQFGYYLFMLVLIKAIVPFQLAMPLPQISLFDKMEMLYPFSAADQPISNKQIIEKPAIPTLVPDKQYNAGKETSRNFTHTDNQTKNSEKSKQKIITNKESSAQPLAMKRESSIQPLPVQPPQILAKKPAEKSEKSHQSIPVKNLEDTPQQNHAPQSNTINAASTNAINSQIIQPKDKTSYLALASDYLSKIGQYFSLYPLHIILLTIWFLIVTSMIIRLLFTFRYINRITTEAMEVDPDAVSPNFQGLLFISGIKRQVRVMISPMVESPFVCGVFNPVLLLPIDFIDKYNANQIRWILLHELAHIHRWDTLVRLIQEIIQILYFFHPAVWIANRMINQLREFACDDDAILCSNLSRHDCGESFLHVVFQSNRAQIPVPGLIGISNSKTIIKERLMRILDQKRTLYIRIPVHLTGFLILFALAILPFSGFVNAQNSPAPIQSATEAMKVTVKDATFEYTKQASLTATSSVSVNVSETVNVNEDGQKIKNLAIPVEKAVSIEFSVSDGNIDIQPQTDSKRLAFVDVVAEINVSNEDEDALPEAEFLKFVEKIDVVADRDVDAGKIWIHPVIPKEFPNGIGIEINLKALVPATLAVKTTGNNGNTTIEGMKAAVESRSSDGDLEVKDCAGMITTISNNGSEKLLNCSGTITAKSSDGDIEIQNCGNGETSAKKMITVVSQNGDLRITNGTGTITAKSSDGDIQIQNCNNDKNSTEEPVTIVSQNGDIQLGNCNGLFTLKSSDGDVSIKNCSGGENKEKVVFTLISQNGDVNFSNCTGAINTKTMDGDLEIKKNKGAITALSGDGEITIQDADSQVNATTGDGSITVSFTQSPEKDCSFKTNDGEINLTFPGDAKLNLDLQNNEGDIDFDKKDAFQGQAEEHLIKGTLNGGGPLIQARTGDGTISIQRKK